MLQDIYPTHTSSSKPNSKGWVKIKGKHQASTNICQTFDHFRFMKRVANPRTSKRFNSSTRVGKNLEAGKRLICRAAAVAGRRGSGQGSKEGGEGGRGEGAGPCSRGQADLAEGENRLYSITNRVPRSVAIFSSWQPCFKSWLFKL